ncbi:MAG TPA: hypothetical protein PKL99_08475, partial [Syntrophales bacterium]|nr:hypothetical protein [Syntrophales bacterium]
MKRMKVVLMVVLCAVFCGFSAGAEELQVGMTASDWSFPDADGKVFTMESWAGRVLLVNYVDP